MGLNFKNKKGLDTYTQIMQHKNRLREGEVAYCKDTNQTFTWHDNQWQEIKVNFEGDAIHMSLYELNAQIMEQLPNHTTEQLQDDIKLINEYDQNKYGKYYMLLCSEYNYYTVLVNTNSYLNNMDTLGEAVIDCLNNIGAVRSCDYDNINLKSAVDIWVKIPNKEIYCFHLFKYDEGIVDFSRGK